jgi:hypothetical protein
LKSVNPTIPVHNLVKSRKPRILQIIVAIKGRPLTLQVIVAIWLVILLCSAVTFMH